MKPLDNVKIIEVKDGVVTITYKDGTKFTTKDDITLGLDYKNENDYPLVDHCIQHRLKMKAILEFNLPEDQPEFNTAIKGGDWRHVCWQMDQYLRQRVKYDEGITEEQLEAYEDMRGEFWRMMKENNVDLYEVE